MNPATCPPGLDLPECMPHSLTEHEAHIALLVWFIALGAALVVMLTKADWKNAPRLVWALLVALCSLRRRRDTKKQSDPNSCDPL